MPVEIAAYADLIQSGVTPRRIRTMTAHRGWLDLRRGIYAEGASRSLRQRLGAIEVGLGRGWVASHATAAALHELVLLRPYALDQLVVTVPSGTLGHSDPVETHVHRARLPAHHLTAVDGVPVTTVARTLVDLARHLPLRDGLVAIDGAAHSGQVARRELERVVADCARWPYIRRARHAVSCCEPATESPLESVSRLFFRERDIPMPDCQITLTSHGSFLGRPDFWWERQGVVGEADGLAKYADASVLRAEKLRQERLENAGLRVVRWTWDDVTRPAAAGRTAVRLRRALGIEP